MNDPHPLMLELERVECQAWRDLLRMAPPAFIKEVGLQTVEINHALFFMASRIPQFQFNCLEGTGLNGDDGSSIAEAVRRFRAAGQPKFFIQIPPGPNASECARRARELGLVEHPLAWAKFHRPTANPPVVETSLEIREIGPAERDVFAATAVAGFGMPPPMLTWLAQLPGRPHWHTYLTFAGSEPAGTGAVYVDGDFAWVGIGATRPEMRRKGGQSALLARRIADAGRFGARHVSTETGVPQAGQPAPSYANLLKSGFTVAYVRPNWSEARWVP